jgi:hypothetical protein
VSKETYYRHPKHDTRIYTLTSYTCIYMYIYICIITDKGTASYQLDSDYGALVQYIYIYIYACIITDKGTATFQRDSDSGAHVQLPALQLRRMRSRRNSNSRGVKVFFFLPSPTPPSLFFSLFRSLPTSLSHTPLSLPSLPSLPPSIFRSLCVFYCLSCSPGGGTWCCTEDFPVLNSNL